jgi:hypothetical protein
MKRTTQPRPLGLILWEGRSRIDGSPVVVIANGFRGSKNVKTGNMLQVWILRADMPPIETRKAGLNKLRAICGNCPLMGKLCYVRVEQAPRAIYKAWLAGRYERYVPAKHDFLFSSRCVRFGAYGDPAAAPYDLWEHLWLISAGHTGYTHQHADPRFKQFANLVMASVESPAAAKAAQSAGWRTFRMGLGAEPIKGLDILCPAGRGVQCKDCGLCKGGRSKARSIYIQGHGGKSVMRRMREFFAGQQAA